MRQTRNTAQEISLVRYEERDAKQKMRERIYVDEYDELINHSRAFDNFVRQCNMLIGINPHKKWIPDDINSSPPCQNPAWWIHLVDYKCFPFSNNTYVTRPCFCFRVVQQRKISPWPRMRLASAARGEDSCVYRYILMIVRWRICSCSHILAPKSFASKSHFSFFVCRISIAATPFLWRLHALRGDCGKEFCRRPN